MQPEPIPPDVSVSWRWFLLPHERWIARRASARFQRLGLRNPSQFRIVAKHGTQGLMLFVVAAANEVLFAVLGVAGFIALLASGGESFAYWMLGMAIFGELYGMARLVRAAAGKPNEHDRQFLSGTGHAPGASSGVLVAVPSSLRAMAAVNWMSRVSTIALAVVVFVALQASTHRWVISTIGTAAYLVVALSLSAVLARAQRRRRSDRMNPGSST